MQVNEISIQRVTQEGGLAIRQSNWPSDATMELLATASVAGMDVLLTWNCRHMANPHSLPLTKKIVRKAGFHCPDIMTPKTFLDNIDLEK